MNAPTSSDTPDSGDAHIARNRLEAHLDAADGAAAGPSKSGRSIWR